MEPHEGGVAGTDQVSLDGAAPQRIGPVENDDGHARLRARLERQGRRPLERVDPRPDVLQVHEQEIDPFEHAPRRRASLRIEAVNRDPQIGIDPVPRFDHVVLLLAADAVLGTEQGPERPAAEPVHDGARRLEPGGHGSRVHEQPDPAVPEPSRPRGAQHVETRPDARGREAPGPPAALRPSPPHRHPVLPGRRRGRDYGMNRTRSGPSAWRSHGDAGERGFTGPGNGVKCRNPLPGPPGGVFRNALGLLDVRAVWTDRGRGRNPGTTGVTAPYL